MLDASIYEITSLGKFYFSGKVSIGLRFFRPFDPITMHPITQKLLTQRLDAYPLVRKKNLKKKFLNCEKYEYFLL